MKLSSYKQKNFLKHRRLMPGFTLVEVLVSTALFAVIVVSVTSLFKLSIDAQREAMSVQNTQESLKYFLEMTAKEIRMAQRDGGVCDDVDDNKVFKINQSGGSDTLYFKNYYGECVSYYIDADENTITRFTVRRYTPPGETAGRDLVDYISPGTININQLNFDLRDNVSYRQPLITINVRAQAVGASGDKSEMILQTSVSSRYYRE